MKMTRFILILALVVLTHGALAQSLDPATGLVKAPGFEMVRAHCSGCHSTRLVTQQRASKAQWRALIRWMQAEQNLWDIPAQAEEQILDYLARHYAAPKARRRAALPPALRPPNPYGIDTEKD
jgi:hypothetical protein